MFARLSNLLGRSWVRRPAPARRPARTRLGCEALEVRDVPALLGPSDFMVNTATNLTQYESVNATNFSGTRSVVVWTHEYSSTDKDIRAQIYDGNGNKVGGEIWVASSGRNEYAPSVGMDAAGNFVVAWTDNWNDWNKDVRAARFTANGARIGGEILVATSGYNEYDSDVAVSPDGRFVIGYTYDYSGGDQDLYSKVYDANGSFMYTTRIATSGAVERNLSVACTNDTIVYAYQWQHPATGLGDIFVQRWTMSGTLMHSSVVASVSGRNNANPDVGVDLGTDGITREATVVYQSWNGFNWDIMSRTVGPTGSVSDTATVISGTAENETAPSLALGQGSMQGGWVVAYQSRGSDGVTRIKLRESRQGSSAEYVLTESSARALGAPSVSMSQSGRYLVTYAYTYISPYFYSPNASNDVYGRFGQHPGNWA
jgi:hypothetical protein